MRVIKTRQDFIKAGMCKCMDAPAHWSDDMKVLYGQEVEVVRVSEGEAIIRYAGIDYVVQIGDFTDGD